MDILSAVNELVTQHGTCNPFRICEFLDIKVVQQSLGEETRGLIKPYKRSYIICINSDLNELGQLHTCAHELGHYKLHKRVNTLFMRACTYLKTDLYEM